MDEKGRQLGDDEITEIVEGAAPESQNLQQEQGKLMRFVKKVGAPIAVAATMILGGHAVGCDNRQNNIDNSELDGGIPDTVPEDAPTYPFAFLSAAADLNYNAFSIMYMLPQNLPSGQPIESMRGSMQFVYKIDGQMQTTNPKPYTFSKGSHVVTSEEIEGIPRDVIPREAVVTIAVDGEQRSTKLPICGDWCEQAREQQAQE